LIGRKNGNPVPNIILGNMGVQPLHAIIRNKDGNGIFLAPFNPKCSDYLYLNGDKVVSET
jgi:hypothetical protein